MSGHESYLMFLCWRRGQPGKQGLSRAMCGKTQLEKLQVMDDFSSISARSIGEMGPTNGLLSVLFT